LAVKKSSKTSKQERGPVFATVGLDVSDRNSCWIGLSSDGKVSDQGKVATRSSELERWAMSIAPTTIALEAGPHSPWISRLLTRCGHEAIVGNPAKLPSISRSRSKSDWRDAEQLARLARFDRSMLHEIKHRGEEAQRDLQAIRSRDAAVRARSKLVSHVRSTVKAHGQVIGRCSTDAFARRARAVVTEPLREIVEPIVEAIDKLSATIRSYDDRIEELARDRYPDTRWLMQIKGVGALTALAYVLVLADASRFRRSRMVGPYLGLVPARDQSGESDPQKGISKEGDRLMRRLLVQSAHYILGPHGVDSDLRRHGQAIAARGGKNATKRAAIGVARKLAVLLHHLWVSHDEYVPLFNHDAADRVAA
jgi:transposase